jgi:transcriptional regulator with XRE-family HTH domain
MTSSSPTIRQRRLARLLRQLREDAGLTIEQVAEKVELSPSTISRIETAQVGVRTGDLRELLDIYEISGAQRDELLQLARERRKHPWWQEYKDLPESALAGFEAEAASISQYSSLLVPSLLQTEDYARAVLRAIRFDATPVEIERRLELRRSRQALLSGDQAPHYWVILDEAVLRRTVGGRQTMHAQVDHLGKAAVLTNVHLQVLPFGLGEHAGMNGEFTIFKYFERSDPDVVYIDSAGEDLFIEASSVTQRYGLIFDYLRASAPHPSGSIPVLTDLEHQLRGPEGD